MSWWPRHFAAWLAALTSLALLLALASAIPRKSKGVSVLVASNPPAGNCGDGPPPLIVHVTPTGLLLNDRPMLSPEIKDYLRHATRNLLERVVFVDGDPTARFADVADVFSMLHSLQIQAAMLTPAVDRNQCFSVHGPAYPLQPLEPLSQPNPAVQPVAWWRFW